VGGGGGRAMKKNDGCWDWAGKVEFFLVEKKRGAPTGKIVTEEQGGVCTVWGKKKLKKGGLNNWFF